jgi:hypothetical protein
MAQWWPNGLDTTSRRALLRLRRIGGIAAARGPVIVRVYASLLAGGSNTATVREELPEAGSGGCLRGALRFSMENVTRSGNTNAYADENAHKIVDGSHNVRFSHSHVVSR